MLGPGDDISHYKLSRLIGRGGMGEVWLAHDAALDRQVAIKFLGQDLQSNAQARERFLHEAKAAAALDHPFICKIYEAGEQDGLTFIVMEYVEGCNLEDRMKEAKIPARDAIQVALEIAEALETAHGKGIVHRDLKPANIMCTPQGHAKVMDFGIAKRVGFGSEAVQATLTQMPMTAAGMIVGTIDYMSPEQAKGLAVDGRSDIFSLGIILYELLAGRNPFAHPTPAETLSAVIKDPPPAFALEPKNVGPELHRILKRCLAKNPDDRYPGVADLAADLRKVREEVAGRGGLFSRRWQVIAALGLAAILVLAGLLLVKPGARKPEKAEAKSISLIIADVQDRTANPAFEGVLEQLLGISLGGTENVAVFERSQAIGLIRRLDPGSDGRLSDKTVRPFCLREGINVIVNASIEKDGNGYLLKAAALDPVSGKELAAAERTIRSKPEILTAADYLSAKLRQGLGVIPEDSSEAIIKETFTTTSLEAMKAYALAQELDARGKEKEAIDAYLTAIDNDPNFGRAYAGLAASYYAQGQWPLAEKYYKGALARLEQMTEREKHRTWGGYYLLTQNYKKAIDEYSALVKEYPRDLAGYTNLALSYFMGYRMAEAFQEGLKAVEIDPENLDYRYNQSWYALASGDFERARQEALKTLQIDPSYAKAFVVLALVETAADRRGEAQKICEKLRSLNSLGASLAAAGSADLAIYEGRLSQAVAILESGIAADVEAKSSYAAADKGLALAAAYLGQGQRARAVEAAEQALRTNRREEFMYAAARIFVAAGEDDKARDIAGELSRKVQDIHLAYAKIIGGELSLKRGDAAGARKMFDEAQTIVDTWLGRFALGRAYLEADAFPEAAAEFAKCAKRRGEAMSVFLNDLPTARYLDSLDYYIGRALDGQENREAARRSYEKFLGLKAGADPGDPLVAEARRRLELR